MITVARDPGALLGAIPCSMGLTFTYLETSDRERMEDALLQGGPEPPKNEVWVYQTDGVCLEGGDSFTKNYYDLAHRHFHGVEREASLTVADVKQHSPL